jgi:hypothetical protein
MVVTSKNLLLDRAPYSRTCAQATDYQKETVKPQHLRTVINYIWRINKLL